MSRPRSTLQMLLAGAFLLLAGARAAGAQPPPLPASPYARLFTAATRIRCTDHDANNRSRVGSTSLMGPIWQPVSAASDTAWLSSVNWESDWPLQTTPAPAPDVPGFLSLHYGASFVAHYADSGGGDHRIRFDAGSDSALRYFRSPPTARSAWQMFIGAHYDFYCVAQLNLEIRGVAVWMAPRGIRFDNRVTIRKAAGALEAPTLVVVTEPNGTDTNFGDYRDVGLWFFDQGVAIEDGVRVLLVSSGHVRMEIASVGEPGTLHFLAPDLGVLADRITLMGPRPGDGVMTLAHPTPMDSVADHLVQLGALPNVIPSPVTVESREVGEHFVVGPVPAHGTLRFRVPAGQPGDELEILDIAGRRVWRMAVPAAAEFLLWNGESATGSVRSGVYFARLRHQGVTTTRKLVWAE